MNKIISLEIEYRNQMELSKTIAPVPTRDVISGYYEKINSFPTGTTPGALTVNEQTVLFEIPSGNRGINLSTFCFHAQLTSPAAIGAGQRYYFRKGTGIIKRLRVYTKSGRTLYDANDLHVFSNSAPYRNDMEPRDFGRFDVYGDAGIVSLYNGAKMANDEIGQPNQVLSTWRIHNLAEYAGGLFKIDRDLLLTEGMFVEITLCTRDQVGFIDHAAYPMPYNIAMTQSTDNAGANPVAGSFQPLPLLAGAGQADALGGDITLTNIKITYSQQADDAINISLNNTLAAKGVEQVPIEYVSNIKYSTVAGTNHYLTHRITSAMGMKLKEVIYIPGESILLGAAGNYSRLRYGQNAYTGNVYLQNSIFQMDGRQLQNFNVIGKDYDLIDYKIGHDSIGIPGVAGGNVQLIPASETNLRYVSNNFFLPYKFENAEDSVENTNSGVITVNSDKILNVTSTTSGNIALDHYIFVTGVKYLKLAPGVIDVV